MNSQLLQNVPEFDVFVLYGAECAAKRGAQAAAVRIQLHTGRTHQIRVHFEALR
jgi:16S rRNA U516 pseudouridylate synthase RsuA-like enzyme